MNYAKLGKNRIDFESFFTIIVMSLIAGIGTYALFGVITGIRVLEYDRTTVLGCVFGLSGIFFGVLSLIK